VFSSSGFIVSDLYILSLFFYMMGSGIMFHFSTYVYPVSQNISNKCSSFFTSAISPPWGLGPCAPSSKHVDSKGRSKTFYWLKYESI
jgi:hypothetical protein